MRIDQYPVMSHGSSHADDFTKRLWIERTGQIEFDVYQFTSCDVKWAGSTNVNFEKAYALMTIIGSTPFAVVGWRNKKTPNFQTWVQGQCLYSDEVPP